MRRRAGVGAIQRQKIQQDKFKEKGNEIQENQLEQMKQQLDKFKENLEQYASKHKQQIKRNATFRKQFQEMCASIGVDPLASGKGFWSEMLGVGDFYYELGVRVVEVGVSTGARTGGVVAMAEMLRRLNARAKDADARVAQDDVIRAIDKLRVLGSGMEVIDSGTSKFICCVPGEISMDHSVLLQQAEECGGFVTAASASAHLRWPEERALRALDHLISVGVAWRDEQQSPHAYWFPALFRQATNASDVS